MSPLPLPCPSPISLWLFENNAIINNLLVKHIWALAPEWLSPDDPKFPSQLALVRTFLPHGGSTPHIQEVVPEHVLVALGWVSPPVPSVPGSPVHPADNDEDDNDDNEEFQPSSEELGLIMGPGSEDVDEEGVVDGPVYGPGLLPMPEEKEKIIEEVLLVDAAGRRLVEEAQRMLPCQ